MYDDQIRDIKINLIETDFDLTISDKSKSRFVDELRFIKDECPDDIITGSLALNLYGLIDRKINDIDIIIKDKSRYDNYRIFSHQYSSEGHDDTRLGYIIFDYKTSRKIMDKVNKIFTSKYKVLDFILETFIRTYIYNIVNLFSETISYTVDFFIDSNNRYETFEFEGHEYKIQYLMNIINTKAAFAKNSDISRSIRTNREKHNDDLRRIFSKLKYKESESESVLEDNKCVITKIT